MKRVQSNLLQQNVFLRDVVGSDCLSPVLPRHRVVDSAGKYSSLDERVVSDGIKQRIVKEDYPITPEYVQSFADGCLDAIAAERRQLIQGVPLDRPKNLGDVSAFGEFASMDTASIKDVIRRASAALDAVAKNNSSVSADDNKDEVK
ncbi:hypothetical protein [Sigmofec virus UA08Rod_6219]|uniref:Uncharacterized protein n=1 Tax=Sigmofec virus UA08Rod_6219 TaxID=2929225 RepID=A0A976R7W3_9VIRU|nr:hypothetical protein [Sigmofec virus UA08Rod_6219]